jgi:hypothetical protein
LTFIDGHDVFAFLRTLGHSQSTLVQVTEGYPSDGGIRPKSLDASRRSAPSAHRREPPLPR